MGSHRHLRFPSMSFIYKCSFRKPEWCFCFSRFGEESFFASTVTRLKPALSVFSIAIELKLIIACKGTDNKLVSQDGFHRTLTFILFSLREQSSVISSNIICKKQTILVGPKPKSDIRMLTPSYAKKSNPI